MGTNGPARRTVTVVNPNGFHMRPAMAFAEAAKASGCRVAVYHGDKRADGVSLLELISLVALPGNELLLEVDGQDADPAADALAAILAAEGDGE